MITACPEIKKREMTADDKFILMGCDGIWECMSNQELIKFCSDRIESGSSLKDILVELLDKILAKDTSSIVFFFTFFIFFYINQMEQDVII